MASTGTLRLKGVSFAGCRKGRDFTIRGKGLGNLSLRKDEHLRWLKTVSVFLLLLDIGAVCRA